MAGSLPRVEHIYQNHFLDSTRWDHLQPRDDDIVVATPLKSGTTWIQSIVLHLIFQDLQPRAIGQFSLWIDRRTMPVEEMVAICEAQTHRRCLKTHLPLDGLRYLEQAKYIVVGRDPRDVFMSLWNHYSAYTPSMYEAVNETPGRVGPPLEPCPKDIRDFWALWINKGWFAWESEGYPHWSNFRHVQSWWNYQHLPNVLLVHFNDLLADLAGEIARIAHYLEIDCSRATLSAIADLVTFKNMKRDAETLVPDAHLRFKGGAKTFFNKGTNGRWRRVLTNGDLEMYDATVARELSPDCHHWLEQGRLATAPEQSS
jgi:aryl sulfotransferase